MQACSMLHACIMLRGGKQGTHSATDLVGLLVRCNGGLFLGSRDRLIHGRRSALVLDEVRLACSAAQPRRRQHMQQSATHGGEAGL
jgi:hypothetical protein